MLVWDEDAQDWVEQEDYTTSPDSTTGLETPDWANTGDFSNFKLSDVSKFFSGKSPLGVGGQLLGIGGISALLNKMLGGGSSSSQYAGYQGGIPKYTAERTQYALPAVPLSDKNQARVTDEGIKNVFGQEGFTDDRMAKAMYRYGISPERVAGIMSLPVEQIQDRYKQALGPNQSLLGGMYGKYDQTTHPARGTNTGARDMDYEYRRPGSGGITYFSPMQYNPVVTPAAAAVVPAATDTAVVTPPETIIKAGGGSIQGSGIASLGGYSDGGQLLRGPGDGVSDDIPATISGRQPARLADGEFVVPARIVSELGNGSTEAGARKLYAMMDRIKATRSKAKNIAANTKADKHLPA
jgi:hypothetical protein|tara:strand:- start:4958 stop:6016 length:1059 start_codon:yes stop_codon:yes gene_type:complete